MARVMSNIRLQAASPFKRRAINGSSEGGGGTRSSSNCAVHFKQGTDLHVSSVFQFQNGNRK